MSLSLNAKALMVASMPVRGRSRDPSLPTYEQNCRFYGVSEFTVRSAIWVLRDGTPALQQVVKDDLVPVSVGRWMSQRPAAEQDEFAARVLAGAHWRHVVPPRPPRGAFSRNPAPVPPRPIKPAGLGREAISAFIHALAALEHLLDTTEGITHEITPAEAAGWLRDLSRRRRYLVRLTDLLKERTNDGSTNDSAHRSI